MTTTDQPRTGRSAAQEAETAKDRGQEMIGGATDTARKAADTVAGAAGELSARIPEVAQSTREAVGEANRFVRRGSDDALRLGLAAVGGLALGLFLGGAHRLAVLGALVPAALIGWAMAERSGALASTNRVQAR